MTIGRWMVIGCAMIGTAAQAQIEVVACRGVFYDTGVTMPVDALYRLGDNDVQVWNPEATIWQRFGCRYACDSTATSARVRVQDAFQTAQRRGVRHELTLSRHTGVLHEAWTTRDGVLFFDAQCRPGIDPRPDLIGADPSSRTQVEYSVPQGIPYPVRRAPFEPPYR